MVSLVSQVHVSVSDAIAHQDALTIWSGFDAIKNTGCGGTGCFARGLDPTTKSMRANVYHYGLFIHFYEDPATQGSDASFSGKSKDSRNFVVSMGSFAKDGAGHGVGRQRSTERNFDARNWPQFRIKTWRL